MIYPLVNCKLADFSIGGWYQSLLVRIGTGRRDLVLVNDQIV